MKHIMIEVSEKEAAVIAHYALKLTANRISEGNVWNRLSSVISESKDSVWFQVYDDVEENELKQRGVQVRNGMAMASPQQAAEIVKAMAADKSAYKNMQIVTSIVRKLASKLGIKMPKIEEPSQDAGRPGEVEMGVSHQGADKAKYAETEKIPDLMSQEEHDKLYSQVGYEPQQKQTSVGQNPYSITPPYNDSEGDNETFAATPGTASTFEPRIRSAPTANDEETIDTSTWADEVDEPTLATTNPEAWKAARQQDDIAQLTSRKGAQHVVPQGLGTNIPRGASVQDPNQQQKTAETQAGTEDLMSIFDDPDLKEAYKLLGIKRHLWENYYV